ncbi:hypothetical protein [Chryseolinea lacunae]|uniref:Adenylosuccinate lyase n=1 Tax=Chryseolinea lacunae TaxID=2801331 RepID=A0ABS1KY49_9BACT|nr:hypothetical protein [Chryseolinea lacunae]MBL0744371.1 hypothetical protein [Chryseolinea lacunae]
MDLTKALEKEHSKAQMTKIVDYVGHNKTRFKALVEVYLAGPYRITQRAAWPLSVIAEHHPNLILPHLKQLLDFLKKPGIHDAVKRNTMRLLQFVELPKRYHGKVAALAFGYLQSKSETVAVKVFSMTVLLALVQSEPELKEELKIIIEDQMPYAKPAFLSRGAKTLKALAKMDRRSAA